LLKTRKTTSPKASFKGRFYRWKNVRWEKGGKNNRDKFFTTDKLINKWIQIFYNKIQAIFVEESKRV